MNLLLVSLIFPPIKTRTSFYAKNLARSLQDRGNQVTVVTLENEEADPEPYPYAVHRLPALHLRFVPFFKHFRVSAAYPRNFNRLRQLARDSGAQTVLLVDHYLDIAFRAAFAAKACGIPLLCSVGTELQSSDPLRHRLLNVLDRLICKHLIFPHCDRIIAWDREILGRSAAQASTRRERDRICSSPRNSKQLRASMLQLAACARNDNAGRN